MSAPQLQSQAMAKAQAARLVECIRAAGITLAAMLPDAWMAPLIDAIAADGTIRLVRVAREEEGVGICAGAFLGGRKAVLIAQNAGFLLSANAIAARNG